MKKNIALLLSLLLYSSSESAGDCCRTECKPKNSCDCEITSRSYLSVRPHFKPASPEMISGFRTDRSHAREEGRHGAIQAVIYGSKSTDDRSLARYFFPFCKTSLIVEEFNNTIAFPLPTSSRPIDILANHFNIITNNQNFKSEISIRPRQTVIGAGFQVRKSFAMSEEKGRSFYTSLSFPVERIKNDLKFDETIIRDGGGVNKTNDNGTSVANMTEAFQQDDWAFGKIKMNGGLSKTGVADIEWKIGYEWIQEEPFHLESYLGILIPTGNKPNAKHLFQPIVGNGHHWGIMVGNSLGIEIWANEATDRSLRMEYASHTQYLFRNTQCRSVDLVCKPWSRYIALYRNQEQAILANTTNIDFLAINLATPGINVLSIPLEIRPGFSHNMTTAALFNSQGWQVEAGYNLYCRQSECIKLARPWQEGPVIKYFSGIGRTNGNRDMTGNRRIEDLHINFTNRTRIQDYKYNYIRKKDLDLASASSPAVITHTVYVAGAYRFDNCDYPYFLNAGGSYEFNKSNNAGIERWTIWGKVGFSF